MVKTMQRNWIGRSEGVEITFDVADTNEKWRFTPRVQIPLWRELFRHCGSTSISKFSSSKQFRISRLYPRSENAKVAEADLATMEKKEWQRAYLLFIH